MKNIIHFEPLTEQSYAEYIAIGTKAYQQHYLHLWPNQDASPYLKSSFTQAVLEKEALDDNTVLYIIRWNKEAVGIFKITLQAPLKNSTAKASLCVNKIYVLKEYSGKGIGKKVLQFATLRAKELKKEMVWLDTMQKGPALHFYLKNGFEIHSETTVQLPTVLEDEKLMWILTKTMK